MRYAKYNLRKTVVNALPLLPEATVEKVKSYNKK